MFTGKSPEVIAPLSRPYLPLLIHSPFILPPYLRRVQLRSCEISFEYTINVQFEKNPKSEKLGFKKIIVK